MKTNNSHNSLLNSKNKIDWIMNNEVDKIKTQLYKMQKH